MHTAQLGATVVGILKRKFKQLFSLYKLYSEHETGKLLNVLLSHFGLLYDFAETWKFRSFVFKFLTRPRWFH